jgi:protein phosphatase
LSVEDLLYAFEGVNDHDFIRSLDSAAKALQRERNTGVIIGGKIQESLAELRIPKRLAIVGDIHGDLISLRKILTDLDFEAFLGDPDNKLIFLGDYVDRGINSVGVMFVISCLKEKFPDSVILMRGNHEAPVEFPFLSHDLPVEVIRRYGYEKGKLIYNEKILPFFRLLTLATLIKGSISLVHGGVPTGNLKYNFKRAISTADQTYLYNSIMEEILWNDPRQGISTEDDWEYSRRGIGKHFGIEISRKWLRLSDTRVIVRGHEPCQGFRIDHNGSVMTLFSCRAPYPKFQASYLLASKQDLMSLNDAIALSHGVIKI